MIPARSQAAAHVARSHKFRPHIQAFGQKIQIRIHDRASSDGFVVFLKVLRRKHGSAASFVGGTSHHKSGKAMKFPDVLPVKMAEYLVV